MKLFVKNNIHATWAVVGFLFFNNKIDLMRFVPDKSIEYKNDNLSPYPYILNSKTLNYDHHFAPEIISLLKNSKGQEIASHTFSHYYTMENGQTIYNFKEDIELAVYIANKSNISINSFVFPRNQCNHKYLSILSENGIRCYRGTEKNWIYKFSPSKFQTKLKRVLRLIDAYINITGYNTYFDKQSSDNIYNYPSSRFLRPYNKKLAFLDSWKIRRIKEEFH